MKKYYYEGPTFKLWKRSWGPTFKLWGGSRVLVPRVLRSRVLGSWSHFYTMPLFCYIFGEGAENQQLMRYFIQDLRLDFQLFLDLFCYLGSSRWMATIARISNNVNTSYWVENLQLLFDLSIKRAYEFQQ